MKKRHVITGVVLALLLALVMVTGALAEPPKPSSFFGTVLISGGNVPVGTAVTAWCGGVSYAAFNAIIDTKPTDPDYGYTVYAFNVPGDDLATSGVVEGCTQGQTIIFMVGTYTADQTGIWNGATNIRLNLTVTPTSAPVTISGNAGVAGAIINYSGGSTTADASGNYSFGVSLGWVGIVTPSLSGYTFHPNHLSYFNVLADQFDQDYSAVQDNPPPIPSSFLGTIKANGANVPRSVLITARINGHIYAKSVVQLYQGDTVYSLDVPGDDPATPGIVEGGVEGDTVVFFIGNVQADQQGTWHSGTNVNINLTTAQIVSVQLYLPLIIH